MGYCEKSFALIFSCILLSALVYGQLEPTCGGSSVATLTEVLPLCSISDITNGLGGKVGRCCKWVTDENGVKYNKKLTKCCPVVGDSLKCDDGYTASACRCKPFTTKKRETCTNKFIGLPDGSNNVQICCDKKVEGGLPQCCEKVQKSFKKPNCGGVPEFTDDEDECINHGIK